MPMEKAWVRRTVCAGSSSKSPCEGRVDMTPKPLVMAAGSVAASAPMRKVPGVMRTVAGMPLGASGGGSPGMRAMMPSFWAGRVVASIVTTSARRGIDFNSSLRETLACVPQRLKPLFVGEWCGTAEAVPCNKTRRVG